MADGRRTQMEWFNERGRRMDDEGFDDDFDDEEYEAFSVEELA